MKKKQPFLFNPVLLCWMLGFLTPCVMQAFSTNANLSALSLSSGTLSPTFSAATTNYNASVADAVTSITVTPTTAIALSTIRVQVNLTGPYVTVLNGNPSAALALNPGTNYIEVKVTASDGVTVKSYFITVCRLITPSVSAAITAGNQTICAGTSVTFTATPTNGGTTPTYQWKKNSTNISGETNSTYTSATLANNDIIECVMTSNLPSCLSSTTANSTPITMTVSAKPVPNFTASAYGYQATFANTSTGGSTYNWRFGDAAASTSQVASPTFTYTSNGTYTTWLRVTSAAGCVDSISKIVTISAAIAGNATASVTNICIGSSTQLSVTGASGDTLQWQTSLDSSIWTNTANVGAAALNASPIATTYYRFKSSGSGAVYSNAVKVTVNPLPVPNFTVSSSGYQATFTNTSTGGNSYAWRFGDAAGSTSQAANPTFTYAGTGTYTTWLRVTSSAGCVDSISKIVTISTAILAGTVSASTPNLCIGSSVSLSVSGASGDVLQWQTSLDSSVWTNTANAGAATLNESPTTTTYYRFKSSGATTVYSNAVKVTVHPKPVPNYTTSAYGYQATFTNTSTGGNSYAWRFGDAAASISQVANPTFTYASNGTYTAWLRVTSTAGCVDSISKLVTIAAAIAGNVAASVTNICIGSSVQLSVAGASGDTLQWQTSLDSSVWTNTANVGAAALNASPTATTYYRLKASGSGVVYSNAVKVSVNPKPVPNFTVSSSGYQATFTNTSTGGNSYAWRFGDAAASTSQTENPTFTYAGTGTYTTWLRVTSSAGCVDSISKIVTISTAILAGTVSTSTPNLCIGSSVSLNVSGASGDVLQWQTSLDSSVWTNTVNTGAATLNESPTTTTYYRFKSSGATTVYSNAVKVTVHPKPVPNYTTSAYGYQATFTNTSTGGNSYAWRFGDAAGSTSQVANPTFTYASNGTYTAWLRVTSTAGCVDSISKIVTIRAALAGNISASVTNICIGSSVQLSVTGASGDTLQWQTSLDSSVWTNTANVGAAALNASPTTTTYYRFKSSGSGVVYSNAVKVTVNPKPVPNFTVSATSSQATFTNTSTGNSSSFWRFGDAAGSTSQLTNPTFTYSNGTYTAWLRVTSAAGCVDSINKIVTVSAAIAGNITTSATNICIGSSVQLSVTGASGDTLQWQTSLDSSVWTNTANVGAAALNAAPTATTYYRFKSSGSGTVYSNAVKVSVNPKPIPNFTFVTTGAQVAFTNTSTGNSSSFWRFGDAAASTSQVANPTFTFSNGTYTAWLRVTSAAGCTDSISKIVTVFVATATAGMVSASATTVCIGSSVQLSVAGASGDTLQWQTSLDSTVWTNSVNAGAAVLNAAPTMTTYYRFRASAANVAYSNAVKVTVSPKPVPNFTVSVIGFQATFANTSTGASTSFWRFGDAAASTSQVTNPTFTYPNGTYTSWLRVTSAAGCVDSISKIVTISAVAATGGTVSASATTVCIGSSMTLSVTGAVGDTLQWQTSLDSSVWTNTATTGAAALNAAPTATTYYRLKANGTGIGYSNIVKVTVNPKPVPNFTFAVTGGQVVFTNTSTGGNTYAWRLGDAAASTSQVASPTFTYSSNGNYTVWLRATSAAGCVDSTSKIVAVTRVSVDKTRLLYGVKVYPNPVQTVLNVEMTQLPLDDAEIVILDALGKIKYVQMVAQHTQIAVRDWSTGIYWIAIRRGGTVQLLDKVLIQN
jgi:PKD repeat protein